MLFVKLSIIHWETGATFTSLRNVFSLKKEGLDNVVGNILWKKLQLCMFIYRVFKRYNMTMCSCSNSLTHIIELTNQFSSL